MRTPRHSLLSKPARSALITPETDDVATVQPCPEPLTTRASKRVSTTSRLVPEQSTGRPPPPAKTTRTEKAAPIDVESSSDESDLSSLYSEDCDDGAGVLRRGLLQKKDQKKVQLTIRSAKGKAPVTDRYKGDQEASVRIWCEGEDQATDYRKNVGTRVAVVGRRRGQTASTKGDAEGQEGSADGFNKPSPELLDLIRKKYMMYSSTDSDGSD